MVIFLIGTTASNLFLFRKDFILSCVENGYTVYALVSEYDDFWLDKIKSLDAQVVTYELSRSGLNPFKDLKTLLQLNKLILTYQPDIVFSFFTKPVIYGSLAARLSSVPTVIGMIEGLGSPFTEHPHGQSCKMKLVQFFQVSLYRIVFPFIDKIIFLNNDDPKDLITSKRIYHRKNAIQVLGGIGLKLEDYPYSPWDISNQISFVIVARLLVEKGIYEYLAAAKIVKEKYPNVCFKVIGGLDTQNPSGLTQQELDVVIQLGVIEYKGFTNQIGEELKNSSVFVLPSYREGVPRSTQEAMAIGRPVITTDVPGCRETVVDGLNGFLVPKWNVDALVEKMCYFVENPDQINRMGHTSYMMACEKFDVNKVNQKLFNIMGLNV
ncbi:N,N'-diacetylbacillosaminyl-diphospho-undecaprenol alpha-1,3-N-acetylgalactosaminyltransferase [Acinetobacter johnsonii]|uniref:glycosyltransferase family 4 protein n=1 Tax=Acinetobacter johnsonii TaxID=40214 RepID=UPI000B7C1D53|nr:N,N'-diacetylbacillosaminyl-diphospho-undecaprenol alpha-1,3-N-acetylgalactosaminyltransferase [Acinetobacter johnsonii]